MRCDRSGGCGPYENRPCNECPASKKEYMLKDKNISIYVAVLNGEVKDNYMAIAFSENEAKTIVSNESKNFFISQNYLVCSTYCIVPSSL